MFNDLKSNVSFIAFRVEGDKISIEEKINNLKKELELNNSDISTLDVYQSEPFWKKVNNLEVFEKTKHNLIRMVIPPANGSKLCKHLENTGTNINDCLILDFPTRFIRFYDFIL